jgi:GT2 family glycosyltransferase
MLRVSVQSFAGANGLDNAVPRSSGADSTAIEEPPPILPLPPMAERPFWSVMIPIYNAREDYLRETLQSVLCQDPGAEEMQIEVLDNCSTAGDAEALVREIGGGRIAFHRNTHNLGIAGNSNACIERARGRWVHILHADDTVRPEFYRRARAGIEAHPEAAAALCRIIYMDGDGQWTGLADLESRQRGLLDGGFAWRQLLDQRIQFVGMVVARSTYEELGGFRPSLPSCLDWDMWKRIALLGKPIHYEPEPLACYRLHEGADSSRLIATAENVREERRSIAYSCASLPASEAMRARRAAAKAAGVRAARRARLLWKKGLRGAAWRQCAAAVRCSLAPAVLARSAFFVLCAIVDRSHTHIV